MIQNKHILIFYVVDNIQVAMNILQEDNYEFSFADNGNKALSILEDENTDGIETNQKSVYNCVYSGT